MESGGQPGDYAGGLICCERAHDLNARSLGVRLRRRNHSRRRLRKTECRGVHLNRHKRGSQRGVIQRLRNQAGFPGNLRQNKRELPDLRKADTHAQRSGQRIPE